MATFGKMNPAGFLIVDFDRTELDRAAKMLACQLGNVHGNVYRQSMPHTDIVKNLFKRGLFGIQIGKVFFFEVV